MELCAFVKSEGPNHFKFDVRLNLNKNNNFIQPANKMLFNTNANSSSDLNNDLKLINNTNHEIQQDSTLFGTKRS